MQQVPCGELLGLGAVVAEMLADGLGDLRRLSGLADGKIQGDVRRCAGEGALR